MRDRNYVVKEKCLGEVNTVIKFQFILDHMLREDLIARQAGVIISESALQNMWRSFPCMTNEFRHKCV